MRLKESSDELNPTEVVTEKAPPPQRRSPTDYLAIGLATCGVGFLPLAPGTWGSLIAVGLHLLLQLTVFHELTTDGTALYPVSWVVTQLVIILFVTGIGIWAGSRTEHALRVKDPGVVVIDEVAGQFIALLATPMIVDRYWHVWTIAAFLLFRFFDIVKPYPARRLESLPGGLGVMTDDLIAGVYAAAVVGLLVAGRSVILGA